MDFMRGAHLVRERFRLSQGQFFHNPNQKNRWWELDGEFFGFGDLTSEDIFRIQRQLTEDEIFQGWNEHHGTPMQQSPVPMIRITKHDIVFHADLLAEARDEEI